MTKILIVFITVFLLNVYTISPVIGFSSVATPSASPAVVLDYTLPFPGILPDHPLYKIKLFRDRILLFFTRDPVKKINLELLMSDKQVVMGNLLWEKGKIDLAIENFTKSEKTLLTAVMSLAELKKTNSLPAGLADKLELSAKKHEEIISKLFTQVGEETKKNELGSVLEITHQTIQQVAFVKE